MANIAQMIRRLALAASLACIASAPALAAASAWHEAAGGRVRLVTSGPVDATGALRGALQIDLKPGWKTYWRDPGSSGVPPQIDVSASGQWYSAALDFPVPQRHEDESGTWAGYDYPVSLPVALQAFQDKSPTTVSGSVFLGLCEKICVPLQAPIDLTIDTTKTSAEENAIVEAAWDALPAPATIEYDVSVDSTGGDVLKLTAEAPAKVVDLFLAGEDGYIFGATSRRGENRFDIDVVSRPRVPPNGLGLHYTLVTEQGAVSGTIPYP